MKKYKEFFYKFIFPYILLIILYLLLIYGILIPSYKNRMLEDKKLLIKELTKVIIDMITVFDEEYKKGNMSLQEAQKEALEEINFIRYGDEHKDYFWINDMRPNMIFHPYRTDLNGKDLSDFKDSQNHNIFKEFVNIVKKDGEGYLYYTWQWFDKENLVTPKLSYVKLYKSWNWIIGTGIYIEDVKHKISDLSRNIFIITFIISIIISLIMFYNIKEILKIERIKLKVEEELILSKDKYKALVEAANDGLLMISANKIIFANSNFLETTGYTFHELNLMPADSFIEEINEMKSVIEKNIFLNKKEVKIKLKDNSLLDTLITFSKFQINNEEGIILIVKDIQPEHLDLSGRQEIAKDDIINEIRSSQFFLYQSISNFQIKNVVCSDDDSILKVTKIMSKNDFGACIVATKNNNYCGIITRSDIVNRCCSIGNDFERPIYEIMSSPIIYINYEAYVYEAIHLLQSKNIEYLVVKDSNNKVHGILHINQLYRYMEYSLSNILIRIKSAQSIEELADEMNKIPVLTKALIQNGTNSTSIIKFISNINTYLTEKVVTLALKRLGEAPTSFAFIVFGSLAREEQTLIVDQDNAIVYQDPEESQKEICENYFLKLGNFICDALNDIGFKYCEGNTLAKNPLLNKSLSEWKNNFSRWIEKSEAPDILKINIYFDFRMIYGDIALYSDLKNFVYNKIKEKPNFLTMMAHEAAEKRVPLDLFGNFIPYHNNDYPNSINLKDSLTPLINTLRVLSLFFGIEENNSIKRLQKIYNNGEIVKSDFEEILRAFDFLLNLRLKVQLDTTNNNPNLINYKSINNIDKVILKKSLSKISLFQTKLNYYFSPKV